MQSIWNMIILMIMYFLSLHIVFIWKISHRTVSISATEPPCINSLIFSGAISGCRILLCVSSFINDVEEKSSLLKVVVLAFSIYQHVWLFKHISRKSGPLLMVLLVLERVLVFLPWHPWLARWRSALVGVIQWWFWVLSCWHAYLWVSFLDLLKLQT